MVQEIKPSSWKKKVDIVRQGTTMNSVKCTNSRLPTLTAQLDHLHA